MKKHADLTFGSDNTLTDTVIAQINAELGRPLRVLHIGNIANNAYNNARIQRQYGIDADVICHDYYHVMATPEWEDGGLTTRLDPYLPNWWESNLKGYKRPDWYVQGPLALCLDYLNARRLGQTSRQALVLADIEDAYINLLRQGATLHKRSFHDPRSVLARFPALVPLKFLLDRVLGRYSGQRPFGAAIKGMLHSIMLRWLGKLASVPTRLAAVSSSLRLLVLWPLLAAAVAEPPRIVGAAGVVRAYKAMRRILARSERDDAAIIQNAIALVPHRGELTWLSTLARLARILGGAALLLPLLPFSLPAYYIARRIWSKEAASIAEQAKSLNQRRAIAERVVREMVEPARWAAMSTEARETFETQIIHHALLFGPLLKHYDIIQGYSIDGFIPLMNGHKAFASYEHGTLRELPFEDSLSGLMCRIAYTHSPAVFITNTDVLPSVERLGLDAGKVHNLPHAFDDRKLMNWRDAHPELAPPAEEVVFFSPTRQHWRDDNPSLTKGNDIMLRAAGALWAEGRRFRLMMVEWGQDIAATRALIDELGFAEAVTWVPPMGKQDLWRTYCQSHAVLDQFILPALGGVGFETLTLGCRLITRTDQPTLARFFGAAPPVLPAASVEEVAASMRAVLDDPQDMAGIGQAGRDWIDQWHSARRTVSIQSKVYRHLLDTKQDIGAKTLDASPAAG
jgi:glycosyltransferase involved in cell wall biosynthesis